MCKEYNGWTNYETWNIKLWLDNEQWMYDTIIDAAKNMLDEYEFKSWLVDFAWNAYIEDEYPKMVGPMSDAINSYWKTIDWYSVARAYREEVGIEEGS